jgi:hypothetical protein
MLRLWALYERDKVFGAFLSVVFLVGLGIALAIREIQPPDDFRLVHEGSVLPISETRHLIRFEAPESLTICKRSSPSELFFLYAIVLFVETLTFGLLLRKVWQLSETGVAPIVRTMLRQ